MNMVIISYVEDVNSMKPKIIVVDTQDYNKNDEIEVPKFIIDLVRTGIQNGTINFTNLWSRSVDITKNL